MEHYLQKTYCKTASLMANCMRAVAVLEGSSPEVILGGRCLGRGFSLSRIFWKGWNISERVGLARNKQWRDVFLLLFYF